MHNHAKGRIARPLLSIFNGWLAGTRVTVSACLVSTAAPDLLPAKKVARITRKGNYFGISNGIGTKSGTNLLTDRRDMVASSSGFASSGGGMAYLRSRHV